MIIQNTPPVTQAVQPEVRASARPEPQVVKVASTEDVAAKQPTVDELQGAVAVLNKFMQVSSQSLQFSVDQDAGRTVVKMVDTSTGELIRQYPSDATLAISRDIDRFQQGLLLRQKA